MDYGAKMLMWAPFAAEAAEIAGQLPKYGTAVSLGALNKVSDSPSFNEAKGFGDNALKVYVSKFKEAAIAAEVTEIPRERISQISGAQIETGDHKNLRFRDSDKAPYGGLGFYVNKILDDGRDVCMGVFYPKVKATLQGTEYNTNGENITLATGKLQFAAAACMSGDWRICSDYFKTEADAAAWVAGMFTGESTGIGKEPAAGGSPADPSSEEL